MIIHPHLRLLLCFKPCPHTPSTLPVSSSRVTDRPPTFMSSFAFPVGHLCDFTQPFSHVPGNPGLPRTDSCDPAPYPYANTFPAHLYTAGPVYTHATQALGSVGSANCGTVFCDASAGAQTLSPLVEDPRHVSPSLQPTSKCFLATITATMEKMSANHGLPPLKVLKLYSDRGSTRW